MAVKKENVVKKVEKDPKELERELLLTEEEYAKKSRQKTKETMNRVLRVVGLVASFILIYAGLFDTLFELSYFGWMADGIRGNSEGPHYQIWKAIYDKSINIYDDPMQFGVWLPKLGITVVVILAVIGTVYLLVYNVVDIIALVKNMLKGTTGITRDITGTVRDTVQDEQELKGLKKMKIKNIFKPASKEDDDFVEKKEKTKKITRRKEKVDISETGGLTEEELDRLLSGESLEEPKVVQTADVEPGEKDLFND